MEALLKSATFMEDHRTFNEGDKFDFKPGVNLIVGDQGVGKSTLIQAILSLAGKIKKSSPVELKVRIGGRVPVHSFDMENDNPRTKGHFVNGVDIATQIQTRFVSHGEMIMGILRCMEDPAKLKVPTIWLLDECDSGLSIRSCYKITQLFKKVAEKGHQIFAVVYSQTIIEEFEEVLSIEHKKWLTSKDFINKQKTEE